jgi:hypothetical protein
VTHTSLLHEDKSNVAIFLQNDSNLIYHKTVSLRPAALHGKYFVVANNELQKNAFCFGLCPSSGILKTKEPNVSEIGPGLRLPLAKGPNRVGASSLT